MGVVLESPIQYLSHPASSNDTTELLLPASSSSENNMAATGTGSGSLLLDVISGNTTATTSTNESLVGGVVTEAGAGAADEHSPSLAQTLWIFVAPFIFIMGIVGNILVLLVMRRRRLRSTSTSIYLRLMAIADICVLITGMIPEWLEACEIVTFKEISAITCKLEKFCFYTCGDTAIWILVVFSVDRFLALVFPLSVNEVCLPSRTKYNALMVLLLSIAKNFHVFWTRGPQYELIGNVSVLIKNCGRPTAEYLYFEKFIRPWIAFTLVSALPFLILIVCNICIINALIKVKKMRKASAVTSGSSTSSDKTFYQMTIMCLSASFCFLVCITPSIVLLIGKPYWIVDGQDNVAYDVAKAINNQLVYFNHSINFFLYCLTGKRFRMELVFMCRRVNSSQQQDSESRLYRFTDRISKSPVNSQHNVCAVNGKVKYSLVNQQNNTLNTNTNSKAVSGSTLSSL